MAELIFELVGIGVIVNSLIVVNNQFTFKLAPVRRPLRTERQ